MGYLKERVKHAVRFRHKRGYGVHSPFMFNLILNVIRDRERLFDYPLEWERRELLRHRERKVFRLLSRLIRYLRVERVVCLGEHAEHLGQLYRGNPKYPPESPADEGRPGLYPSGHLSRIGAFPLCRPQQTVLCPADRMDAQLEGMQRTSGNHVQRWRVKIHTIFRKNIDKVIYSWYIIS